MKTRVLPITLLTIQIMLLIWGFSVLDSMSSDVSWFLTDSPTNKTIWLFIVGLFGFFAGLMVTEAMLDARKRTLR